MDTNRPERGALRAGDAFCCAGCGRDSVVKSVREMDGWQCVGQYLACALCGARVSSEGSATADAASESAPTDARLSAARTFLGADDGDVSPGLVLEAEAKRFCRDCGHYLKHPFVSRCLLHGRAVEPMDDCEDFEQATED